jgi:type VI secretion system secreted protein Hcp
MAVDFSHWQPESPFTELVTEGYEEQTPEFHAEDELRNVLGGVAPIVAHAPLSGALAQPGPPVPPAPTPTAGPLHRASRLVGGRLYARITGQKQGSFTGDVTTKGHEGWLLGGGFDYEVSSPHDPVSGQPTGRRQHRPITLTKAWTAASIQLFQALVTNETLTSVVFEFPGVAPDGVEQIAQRITLTNAAVIDIHRVSDESLGTHPPYDRISFAFETIRFDDLASSTTAQDGWSGLARAELSEEPTSGLGEAAWTAETYELENMGGRAADGLPD